MTKSTACYSQITRPSLVSVQYLILIKFKAIYEDENSALNYGTKRFLRMGIYLHYGTMRIIWMKYFYAFNMLSIRHHCLIHSSKILTTSKCLFFLARSKAVISCGLVMSIRAPNASKRRTQEVRPNIEAAIRGVSPNLSAFSTSAPFRSKILATSVLLLRHARHNAVLPWLSVLSISAASLPD